MQNVFIQTGVCRLFQKLYQIINVFSLPLLPRRRWTADFVGQGRRRLPWQLTTRCIGRSTFMLFVRSTDRLKFQWSIRYAYYLYLTTYFIWIKYHFCAQVLDNSVDCKSFSNIDLWVNDSLTFYIVIYLFPFIKNVEDAWRLKQNKGYLFSSR